MEKRYDVFISCKSEDYAKAESVFHWLVEKGHNPFFAPISLRISKIQGEPVVFGDEIDDALEQADNMVLFASKAEYVSEKGYVRDEWRTFVEEQRAGRKSGSLVTILDGVKVADLPIRLRSVQSFIPSNYKTGILRFLGNSSRTEEGNIKEKEEEERKAMEEAERVRLEKERMAKAEAERLAREATEKKRLEEEKRIEKERRKAEQKQKATEKKQNNTRQKTTNSYNGHEYVDLGLPSGTLWATCNVGANKPEDYGNYLSWDDGKKATAKWGDGWCVPTKEQWEELSQYAQSNWTTWNGVNGRLYTAKNKGSLFLPAAGYSKDCDFSIRHIGTVGNYWSGSMGKDKRFADTFFFESVHDLVLAAKVDSGLSVRLVCVAKR